MTTINIILLVIILLESFVLGWIEHRNKKKSERIEYLASFNGKIIKAHYDLRRKHEPPKYKPNDTFLGWIVQREYHNFDCYQTVDYRWQYTCMSLTTFELKEFSEEKIDLIIGSQIASDFTTPQTPDGKP